MVFEMSVNDESTASRHFVASYSVYSPIWEKITGKRASIYIQAGFWAIVVLVVLYMVGPMFGLHVGAPIPGKVIAVGFMVGLLVLSAVIGANFWWRWRRKYHIAVGGGGLTIDNRRGGVYSFADAQLSLWVNMGVALHLHRGGHRFLLGGRDRRVGPATQLDAPPVQLVDAWLSESDFDELLSLSGRWSGSAARGPAAGGPARCLLYPNSLLIQKMGPFAFGKKQRLTQSLAQPQLFIDVDDHTIRMVDPNSNALTASASLAQVTATPATYTLGGHAFPSAENFASDAAGEYVSATPLMTVSVPGMRPLTIGCRNFEGFKRRFSWGGGVPVCTDPPAYEISPADWLTLVEKLGLASHLQDTAK
jgi:hypothetical protein